MGRVSYSAVVLDNASRLRLLKRFIDSIPNDYEVIAHHMTINMGVIKSEYEKYLGLNVNLYINEIGIGDLVIAVGVESAMIGNVEIKSNNDKQHITLAVNRSDGGKPYMSNKIVDWNSLGVGMKLVGKLTEVEH